MTQEQKTKISEHFDELHAIVSDYGLNVPNDIRDALRAAYLAGADYALEIYSPHWISVKDEQPKEHEWILGYSLKREYIDVYNFDFNGLIEAHGITHWMHLSPPPIITSSKKGD